MFFDWTYLIFIVPALIVSLWAELKVKSAFSTYSKKFTSCGMTGAEAARRVLSANGLGHLKIEQIKGNLTDHYDPTTDTVRLSESVYNSTSCAAIGVACHEAGHAVQHAEEYLPAKIRMAIVPITNIGSKISFVLLPVGIILCIFAPEAAWIAYAGLIGYVLCALFQLVTLPTEFNASKRAMEAINNADCFSDEERRGARKVLTAAALTYVAALFTSIMVILRFLYIIAMLTSNGRRR